MSSAAFGQNEVLLTSDAAKGGNASLATLDLVTDGQATAFEFSIKVPKGVKNVDTSKCLADLPSSHNGNCVYREKFGDILVIAFSPVNAKLPAGIVSLGSIKVDNAAKQLKVEEIVFAGDKGQRLPSAQGALPASPERANAKPGKNAN
jgi:hypothetical protein